MIARTVECWGWNQYGQLGSGDGGGMHTSPVPALFSPDSDSDGDGCSDSRETGPIAQRGGGRSPKSVWDFFDVPTLPTMIRDGVISVSDLVAVVARFGSSGDAGIYPLSQPQAAPSYHRPLTEWRPGRNYG
jgi:hypothetical protein